MFASLNSFSWQQHYTIRCMILFSVAFYCSQSFFIAAPFCKLKARYIQESYSFMRLLKVRKFTSSFRTFLPTALAPIHTATLLLLYSSKMTYISPVLAELLSSHTAKFNYTVIEVLNPCADYSPFSPNSLFFSSMSLQQTDINSIRLKALIRDNCIFLITKFWKQSYLSWVANSLLFTVVAVTCAKLFINSMTGGLPRFSSLSTCLNCPEVFLSLSRLLYGMLDHGRCHTRRYTYQRFIYTT